MLRVVGNCGPPPPPYARQMKPSYLFLLFCTYVLFISLAIEEVRVSGPFGLIDFRPEPTQLLRKSKCTLHQVWHIIRRCHSN